MFLVFYGHLVDLIFVRDHPELLYQFRWIYSFHMPLFFILAGLFTINIHQRSRTHLIYQHMLTRLIPCIFFALLGLCALIIKNPPTETPLNSDTLTFYLLSYLHGKPYLNWVTWFLVCLFVAELLQALFKNHTTSKTGVLFGIVIAYAIGWWLPQWEQQHNQYKDVLNFWFLKQAVMAYAFILSGKLIRMTAVLEDKYSTRTHLILCLTCLLFVAFSIHYNDFSDQQHIRPVVMFSVGRYGDSFLFPLGAFAGTFALIYLAKLIPHTAVISYLGKNTLILLGLNGFFFHHLNKTIYEFFAPFSSVTSVTAFIALVSAASMLCCIPFVAAFNRVVPQLVGTPSISGPLLPRLIKK